MKKLKLLFAACALLLGVSNASAQGAWTAPEVPGIDLSTWENSAKVYIYNVGADAFVCAGMNWNTNAISTRLTNGDDKASGNHSASVVPSGASLKMILDANTSKAIGTNGGDFDCWVDFDHNQDWTFTASENYANAYTLVNTAYAGKKLDVAGLYGGKLTIGGGKGLYDWAFIPASSITDGSYIKYKERKVMYGIYQALVASGKTATYATQLEAANDVYVNASATASELRSATRALIIAVADGIESRVEVTPLFTNADMVGAASAKDWGSNQGLSWGTFEQFHGNITLSQNQTDVPNGLYDVLFNGFFRQDGSDAAPVVSGTGSSVVNGNVIEMRTMASTWGCNANGSNNWKNQSGNIVPDGQKSAGQGLAYEGASTSLNNIPVKSNSLSISATVNSGSQWFIWQGFRIYYSGAINLAIYKKILAAVEEANSLTSAMSATAKNNLTSAVEATNGLSANSDEEVLNTALANLETAIDDAEASIAVYSEIKSLIDGLKTQDNEFNGDTKYDAGTYTAVSEVYADYYAFEANKLGSEPNTDYTKAIVNPGFEFGNTTGWTYEPSVDNGAKSTTDNTYKMEGSEGNYLFNIWSAGHPITQTITNLPKGLYELKAVVANSSDGDPAKVYLITNDTHEGITCNTNAGIGVEGSAKAVVSDAGTLTIGAVGSDNDAERSYSATGVWWYKVDNFRLTYLGDVVSDEDAAEILASVPTGKMNGDVQSALNTAKTTFENSKTVDNYQALQNAIDNANTSIAAYVKAENAIDAAKAIQTNTNVVTADAATTFAEAIAAMETAYNNSTLSNNDANAAANTLGVGVSGWRANPNGAAGKYIESAWDNAADFGDYYINTWSTEGEGDGSNYLVPFFEYWTGNGNSLAAKTMTATQAGLVPEGIYSVSVYARVRQTDNKTKVANGITLQVGEGAAVDMTSGAQIGSTAFYLDTFTATGQADGEGTLTIKINVAGESNISWLSFKDIKYTAVELATAEDYEALNNAIAVAEAKTLGFETGEYAPYNNVAALTSLAEAKAIDQDAVNAKETVVAATTVLTSAVWTANVAEVNAIYNGNFALSENDGAMAGWVTDNVAGLGGSFHARAFVLTSGMTNYDNLAAFGQGDETRSCAYFRFDGTNSSRNTKYTYGSTNGYTMPLKTNTIYKLTAQVGGWGQVDKDFKMTIVNNGDENVIAQNLRTLNKGVNNGGSVIDYEMYFVVPSTGNYKLVFNNPNDVDQAVVVSNIELFSSDALEISESGLPTYAAGEYPTVKLNRTIKEGFNTLVVPFDMTLDEVEEQFGEGSRVYELKSFDGKVIRFDYDNVEKVTANKPCILKATEAGTEYTFTGREVEEATPTTPTADAVTFIGNYAASLPIAYGEFITNYVVSDGKLFLVDSDVTIKGTRAYFHVETDNNTARTISLSFDGEVTGIATVENGEVKKVVTGDIYDLTGRKVKNPSNGIYVVEGKKVVF